MKQGRVIFEGNKFEMLSDLELPTTLSGAAFQKCWFFACSFGMTARSAIERRRIVDVELSDCKATNNSWLGPVTLENVDVQNLQTGGLCIAWGAAFKHVRIRGKCGRLMLTFPPNGVEDEFQRANTAFYANVDWALDISEGEFEELDLRGIPADLVRRDPESQIVVRRKNVERLEKVWRALPLSGTPWPIALQNLMTWELEDLVLVAPKRQKDFQARVAGLRKLQEVGVGDPD